MIRAKFRGFDMDGNLRFHVFGVTEGRRVVSATIVMEPNGDDAWQEASCSPAAWGWLEAGEPGWDEIMSAVNLEVEDTNARYCRECKIYKRRDQVRKSGRAACIV